MLDLEHMRRIKLTNWPAGQLATIPLLLADYRFPRRTEIILEGEETISAKRPVFFAMNHTDRYSYWPFQLKLFTRRRGVIATWVKGKYYENPWLAHYLDLANNIPIPSQGYVLTVAFRKVLGRVPNADEYRALRDLINTPPEDTPELPDDATDDLQRFVGPDLQRFVREFLATFAEYAEEAVNLNRDAIEKVGVHVLVFPEGTRSRRLGVGRAGLAQMTQRLGATIVPVGCSGSDLCYPGNTPFSKGGRIIYRVGKALNVDGPELGAYRVPESVLPLSPEAREYDANYTAITEVVMSALADLLDEPYKPAPKSESNTDAPNHARRFV